jgi:hypothetical protein
MSGATLPTSIKTVVIDPDGDLHLRVGTERCTLFAQVECATVFICDSRTVSRASVVWKKMLNGTWKESRGSNNPAPGGWIVELPEDNPAVMAIILNIIHSRFELLTPFDVQIPLPQLYELAVLTDKYDLTRVIRPWANSWLRPLNDQYPPGWIAYKRDVPTHLDRQLWIAWELGDEVLLRNTLIDMVFNLESDMSPLLEPPGLFGMLQAPKSAVYLQW